MQQDRQLDLFAAGGVRPAAVADAPARVASPPASDLDDDALIAAIPGASLGDCGSLAAEAARRRLSAAIPALAALCRRFKGFGHEKSVPEQVASIGAIGAIGGRGAEQVLSRLVVDQVVQGPGLAVLIGVAARLRCRLPALAALALLRHADPGMRADAARCASPGAEVVAVLLDLLSDLNGGVARASACALGRMGRIEARPMLMRLLAEQPSAEVIDAISSIADETCIVLLGRIARSTSDLAGDALAALEDKDDGRAQTLVAAIRRRTR